MCDLLPNHWENRTLSSGEEGPGMAPWKSRTQMGPRGTGEIFFFFRGRGTLKMKKVLSKQKTTLHPSRVSTQNGSETGTETENAQFRA